MADYTRSFYIPAPSGAIGEALHMEPGPETARTIELVVISGGPVFLFQGRLSTQEAYDRTHTPEKISFNIAASSSAKGELGIAVRYGEFTIHSDNETIGYVRFSSKES